MWLGVVYRIVARCLESLLSVRAGLCIAGPDRTVLAAGNQRFAIGREQNAVRIVVEAGQLKGFFTGRRIPHDDAAVFVGCHQAVTIARKGHTEHLALMPLAE